MLPLSLLTRNYKNKSFKNSYFLENYMKRRDNILGKLGPVPELEKDEIAKALSEECGIYFEVSSEKACHGFR